MRDEPIDISKHITVGPQIGEEELDFLAKKGFKTIINLSKKGELNLKLSPEEEAELVEQAGLDYIHLPVSLANMKDAQIKEFCQEVEAADKPVYVHCRLGQRSEPLSIIYHAIRKGLDPERSIERAQKLGFKWTAPFIPSLVERYIKHVHAS